MCKTRENRLWLSDRRPLFVADSEERYSPEGWHPQFGAGLPCLPVMGPLGLPETGPSCTGLQELKSMAGFVPAVAGANGVPCGEDVCHVLAKEGGTARHGVGAWSFLSLGCAR